jgi:uridylate kinase
VGSGSAVGSQTGLGDFLVSANSSATPRGIVSGQWSTDTASAVRACELDCEAVLKATKVDGVYTADPVKFPDAKKIEKLSY